MLRHKILTSHLPVILCFLFIPKIQRSNGRIDVTDKDFGSITREIFANNHSQKLQVFYRMSHCVSRYNPSTFTQFRRDVKLAQDVGYSFMAIKRYTYLIVKLLFLETECYKRDAFPVSLAQNDKFTSVFQLLGQVISSKDNILHYVSESNFTKSNENIVLRKNVGGSFTEIKGKWCLWFGSVMSFDIPAPNKPGLNRDSWCWRSNLQASTFFLSIMPNRHQGKWGHTCDQRRWLNRHVPVGSPYMLMLWYKLQKMFVSQDLPNKLRVHKWSNKTTTSHWQMNQYELTCMC